MVPNSFRGARGPLHLCALTVLATCLPIKNWINQASVERSDKVLVVSPSLPVLELEARVNPLAIRPAWRFDLSTLGKSIVTPASSTVNHSPTLAALSDGRLAMAWFGGSREGARDVQIYFSRFDGSRWEDARALMSTDGFIAATGRYITKLGNPVLHVDGARLNLWFVAVSLGGWGGARLNHIWSDDFGVTWSVPRLLVSSPFLNVSTLVRSAALSSMSFNRSDGKVSRETLLPAYFELSRKYPVMLRLDQQGRLVDRYPFGGVTGLLQPSVVVTGHKQENSLGVQPLTAYFRRAQAIPQENVFSASSADGGYTWTRATPIGIPNGDASVVAWADGPRTWLVANPSPKDRRSIAAFALDGPGNGERSSGPVSPNQGRSSEKNVGAAELAPIAPTIVLDPVNPATALPQEFSYPSFAQTGDGRLHLVYTADGRRTVRHRIWMPLP
jgi:predicted neuraminidase